MHYFVVEPEVAGGWGPHTVFDREAAAGDRITKLHYEFSGWLGDELLESTPCFIATEKLAQAILKAALSGATFDEVEVSINDTFKGLHPGKTLPKFVRLKPGRAPGRDDFGLLADLRLVVSEHALGLLKTFDLHHATVTPFKR